MADMTVGKRKTQTGRVTSIAGAKSIVIAVERLQRHAVYKRVIRRTAKFMAHDEHGKAHEGDMVRIVESRPLSKNKRWSLKEIIRTSTTGV